MALYSVTIFLSAFLLFQIQPLFAKMILPWFGGSAAVWITAMLFFQTMLLGGYLYAHWSIRFLKSNLQAGIHTLLLAASLFSLPVAPSIALKPGGYEDPGIRILALLLVSIGLPYFLLSSTSPLMQAWYARSHQAALPYRLFALSNLASLLGLLAYPVLIEPNVTLHQQSIGWSSAFAVFAMLSVGAAFLSRQDQPGVSGSVPPGSAASVSSPPAIREKALWLVLAACGVTLLLSITNHLTQNVASIPFLWVLPLGLYLLTFILTFDFERLYRRNVFIWLTLAALGAMAYGLAKWNSHTNIRLVIATFSTGLLFVCLFLHGELVKRKPAPQHLTSFYLMLSAGGALGGVLVGLAAPRLLPAHFELPISLVLCSVLLFLIPEYRRSRIVMIAIVITSTAVLFASEYSVQAYGKRVRVMARNFYGGIRVNEYRKGTRNETRTLVHGTVTHGIQYTSPGRRGTSVSYYGPDSGIYRAEKYLRTLLPTLRVGVIGLGAGSLAAYALPGDVFRFYEINPLVEQLARSEFTYLADCRGTVDVILGDGRLSLEREASQQYDLLVADAFSGDAIPVHLITRQALELYFWHLKPGGILALNIANTHLDVEPVVERLAAALGKHSLIIQSPSDLQHNIFPAHWALLSSKAITAPIVRAVARKPFPRPGLREWTDDYNNLFQILK